MHGSLANTLHGGRIPTSTSMIPPSVWLVVFPRNILSHVSLEFFCCGRQCFNNVSVCFRDVLEIMGKHTKDPCVQIAALKMITFLAMSREYYHDGLQLNLCLFVGF